MIYSRSYKLDLDEIKIPRNYKETLPQNSKICARLNYYREYGTFDREIVVDENNLLRDGYSVYLVAKMLGLKKLRVLRITTDFTYEQLWEMLKKKIDSEWCKLLVNTESEDAL